MDVEKIIIAVFSVCTWGQITTPAPSQCGVNYLDLGPGTTMDPSEFYQTFINDPTVTSLADCTQLCDVDNQCKAIGYSDDSGVSCGLTESDHVTATACTSCHVYTKNCSTDCVTYTVFSGGYIGRTQYANYDPSSYTECQDRCTNDPFCNGFIHNDVIMTCRLSESRTEVAYPGNASFSFSRKECSYGCTNYLAYGAGYIIEWSAMYFLNNPFTQRECMALCNTDPGCRGAAHKSSDQNCALYDSGTRHEYSSCLECTGYAKQCPPGNYPINRPTCVVSTYTVYATNHVSSATYNSATPTTYASCQSMCTADLFCHGFAFNSVSGECELSDSTVPQHLACTECSFSAKDCVVDETSKYFTQCSTNFSSGGLNLTVSMQSSNHDGSDLATCRDLCANDPLCMSFHHSQGDLQCRLSTSDGSIASGCEDCEFYAKDCLPGCDSVTYERHYFGYILASVRLDLASHVTPFDTCQQLCNNDTFCFGFTYIPETSRCVLSNSGTHVWYPECPSCSFSKKLCSLPVPEFPLAVEEVIVSNGTIDCLCVCKTTNQTVDEIMQQRKSELIVDIETLSSTLRKFTSAPDSRPTSTAIGALGAVIIGVLIAFIVLPDLFTAFYCILKYLKSFNSTD